MTRRCVAFLFGLVRLYLCKIFARWVYKNYKRTRWHDQNTESQILFRSCGHETPFSDQKGHQKSGIFRALDTTMRCFLFGLVAFYSDSCVCIFVKCLQDGFTKIQTHAMTRRCVAFLFGFVRLYLCKVFARWVYKNYKRTRWHEDALLFYSDSCVCIFVKYLKMGLQKYKRTRWVPVPEIPDSRFIIYALKRRFMPVWASLNRGFRGLAMTRRCVAFLFGLVRLYQSLTAPSTMRCFFFWIRAFVSL